MKVLLEHEQADLNVEDMDTPLEELLGTGLPYQLPFEEVTEARKLFNMARTRAEEIKECSKVAVIIVNSVYADPDHIYSNLEGPKTDLKLAEKLFRKMGYTIYIRENIEDIRETVLSLLEDNDLESSTDVFQLFFSGHGVFKSTAEKGEFYTGDLQKENNYRQKGEYGDCLVNTNGSLCEELSLAYMVSDLLGNHVKICMFYDMCRSERKEAQEKIIVSNFENRKYLQESGADRRLIRIFSSQVGKTSSGSDSFFQRICEHIELSSPQGVMFGDFQKLEKDKQKCSVEPFTTGWDNQIWPLQ